jgi:hypothetical protein
MRIAKGSAAIIALCAVLSAVMGAVIKADFSRRFLRDIENRIPKTRYLEAAAC